MRDDDMQGYNKDDVAPGDRDDVAPGRPLSETHGVWDTAYVYLVGYVLAFGLTVAAFASVNTTLVWGPGIPVMLLVLAVAQMGVHLVFFLHIGTGPDSTNNVLALAFGVLIVGLLIGGSLWIMDNLNHNVMPHQMHLDPEMEMPVAPRNSLVP
jgi:cytochrome o ubiquinol oxidase subunit IV